MVVLRFLGVVACVILCSCASQPRVQDIPLNNTSHSIYFIYRGWHTSILVDAKTLAAQSPLLKDKLKGQKYARIGFGDGDYFTGKDKSSFSAARALFASGYSAVQLLTYDYEPFAEIPSDTRVRLAITAQGMQALIAQVNQSLAVDAAGKVISLPAMGDSMGYFYRASQSYSAFSNCNTWSGQVLRAAGLPITNRLTASGVFAQAKAISDIQSRSGLFSSK